VSDEARLEAKNGGVFSVDINGVLIRGHFVCIEPPRYIEIAWGEAGSEVMPPGATRLCLTFEVHGTSTRVELEHRGLMADEAEKHAIGWLHFLGRLVVAGGGGDPGPDPWKTSASG